MKLLCVFCFSGEYTVSFSCKGLRRGLVEEGLKSIVYSVQWKWRRELVSARLISCACSFHFRLDV